MIVLQAAILFIFLQFVTVESEECNLPESLIQEIQSYRSTVDKIIESTTVGNFKGKVYDELSSFVNTFGARLSGTENLEMSIDYILESMKNYTLDNVHGEDAVVPHWERKLERATLILRDPANETNIPVLALGGSVSTPADGIQAEIVVVNNFDEVNEKVKGKIVVFNYKFQSYGESVQFRNQGPALAATHGAVAALVRSVTSSTMGLLHAGQVNFPDNVTKIPAVAIRVNDAEMLQQLQNNNYTSPPLLNLTVVTETYNDSLSRNVVAEIRGKEQPEKVVIVSGHIDSWDVGVGAMDDGGGAFISWYSLVILNSLGLKPRRTVRSILWAVEEPGLYGIQAYDKAHQDEKKNFVLAMESDAGTFEPLGIEYVANAHGGCIFTEILKLLSPIGATNATRNIDVVSDISIWAKEFPTASLINKDDRYFWYHHSEADTMDVQNPDEMDKCLALWATVAYIVADLKEEFPRSLEQETHSLSVDLKPGVSIIAVLGIFSFLLSNL